MSEIADILQTFVRGINRPAAEQIGYGVVTDEQQNLEYLRLSGSTAQRPAGAPAGWPYYDTTVENLVVYNGASWTAIEGGGGGGGGLTAPADPADDGKIAIADGGDILWTAPGSVTVGVASLADDAMHVVASGPTTLGFGSCPNAQLLIRSGSNFVGVAASTLTVASAANATKSEALDFNGTVLTADTAPTDGHLLRRSGTTVAGVAASTLSVSFATTSGSSTLAAAAEALLFDATQLDCSSTAPTANQLLVRNGSSQIAGITPGDVMARLTSSSSSTQAITFTANARFSWTGSATPSFTVSKTGAVDGCTIVIYFPGSSLTSVTFSTDIDPSQTLAYAFDDAAAAYVLVLTFVAQSIVIPSFRKVTLL